VLYVEELVVPDAINTMPEATLRAFADHGDPGGPFDWRSGAAEQTLRRAQAAGVDLDAITTELEREGVESFCRSYQELLDRIERKLHPVAVEAGTRGGR
jgi:transaldolase